MRQAGYASMDRMPPVPENVARPADPPRVNDYDILAEAYTAENEASLINAYYARPAILALAGDVAGRRILDAGCGSRPLFAARVLHYLEDWGPALAELRRVLKPGGRLIASVDHPFAIHGIQRQAGRKTDYFATYSWTEDWIMGGQTVPMSFWNRPLHAMTDAFTAAGFRISFISEPHPVPEARELFPEQLAATPSFLCFLFFVLHAG